MTAQLGYSARVMLGNVETRGATLVDRGPGRALLVRSCGRMYVGRGCSIWSSDDDGARWTLEASLPMSWKRRLGRLARIAARALRFEIRALGVLSDGGLVASHREGMYFTRPDAPTAIRSSIPAGEQPVSMPMTLTVGPNDEVVFGEYDAATRHGNPVRIYASHDLGRSFDVFHTFPANEVLHVHSLLFDPLYQHYWVFCGDFDDEPGIGILSNDFSRFDWFLKGAQRYRLCEAFDFGDRLIYATDTPLDTNKILSLDKRSGQIVQLGVVRGSCLYAARFGNLLAFSTTAEPGAFDGHDAPSLWVSRDGDRFDEVVVARKDAWPHAFQFGSLVLPRGCSSRENVFFSGQAVKALDGRVVMARLPCAESGAGTGKPPGVHKLASDS